jgi:DNA-binding GntR family transcriptional regulator
MILLPTRESKGNLSQSDEAYSRIRSMILSLELEPGSLINESDLMLSLGFGRTPIREALRSLSSEKLVQVYPRRGMFVASVDVQNLSAISEALFLRYRRPVWRRSDRLRRIEK